MRSQSDEDLMRIYLQGEPHEGAQAFYEIYRRLAPGIERYYGRKFGQNHSQDLSQQFFLRFHEKRFLYRKEIPLRPWAFTLARHLGIDEFRRQIRRNRPQEEKNFSYQESSEQTFQRQEFMQEIEGKVTLQELEFLEKKWVQEFTYQELSRVQGQTEVSLRKRMERILKKLKLSLSPSGGPDDA